MSSDIEQDLLINRREAIRRVTALLGGVALVGGSGLLTGCRDSSALARGAAFTPEDIAFLDEVAETILPETKTPACPNSTARNFKPAPKRRSKAATTILIPETYRDPAHQALVLTRWPSHLNLTRSCVLGGPEGCRRRSQRPGFGAKRFI